MCKYSHITKHHLIGVQQQKPLMCLLSTLPFKWSFVLYNNSNKKASVIKKKNIKADVCMNNQDTSVLNITNKVAQSKTPLKKGCHLPM